MKACKPPLGFSWVDGLKMKTLITTKSAEYAMPMKKAPTGKEIGLDYYQATLAIQTGMFLRGWRITGISQKVICKDIEQKKEDEQKAEDILKNRPQVMETKSNKTMAVYDTSANKGIFLGHKVFEHHDVDYCLIRISKTKWQLACNPSKKYSMKHLMGEQNIKGHTFSLAGRKNELLAIENQQAKNSQAELHELLIKWLCEHL